jgi:hypothetical protein
MTLKSPRILIADDLPAIHEDYRKILAPRPAAGVLARMTEFSSKFTPPVATDSHAPFQIDSCAGSRPANRPVHRLFGLFLQRNFPPLQ